MSIYRKIKFQFSLFFNGRKAFNNAGEIHIGDFVIIYNAISTFDEKSLIDYISKNIIWEQITGYSSEIIEDIEELWKIKIEVDCLVSRNLIYFDKFEILSIGEHIKNNRDSSIEKIFKI